MPPMVEYLQRSGSRATQVRLKLAEVLVESERRPAQALRMLSKLPVASLQPAERASFARLRQRATAMRAEEPGEIPSEDW